MWNRIDKILTVADIQDITNAVQEIHNKIATGYALTEKQRRKGGWYLSPKALLLLQEAYTLAKADPASFPKLDIAALERDIALIKQLHLIESQILQLKYIVEDTRRLLTKDVAEQGFYVYNLIKVMHDLGMAEGNGYEQLKVFMPRSGKKTKIPKP